MVGVEILRKSVIVLNRSVMLNRSTFHEPLRVLALNSANQLSQELLLVSNIWIIDNL
jgi:hypothetical protein